MMLESPVLRNWHAGFGGGHSEQGWEQHLAGCLPYFFGTLKDECLELTMYSSHEHARLSLFAYLETYYNRKRRPSSLGYISPLAYEQKALGQNRTPSVFSPNDGLILAHHAGDCVSRKAQRLDAQSPAW
jgi:Integrase core domain